MEVDAHRSQRDTQCVHAVYGENKQHRGAHGMGSGTEIKLIPQREKICRILEIVITFFALVTQQLLVCQVQL